MSATSIRKLKPKPRHNRILKSDTSILGVIRIPKSARSSSLGIRILKNIPGSYIRCSIRRSRFVIRKNNCVINPRYRRVGIRGRIL